ncbi:MAG: protein arginine kinase [bacterium]
MKKTIKDITEQATKFASTQAGIESLLSKTPAWVFANREDNQIILSTRIRLARNLKSVPFPSTAKNEQLEQVIETTEQASAFIKMLQGAYLIKLQELDDISEKLLVERRLVSPVFASANHARMVIIDKNEFVSIMVNEEDHLRIQSIQPGLALQEAWRLISLLDDELSERLDYAFSPHFGYLTSCPTNTGTGMRASIQVHIPALSLTHEVEMLIKELAPSEIAVRGYYGEGSEVMGNIYQISNQLTLGRTEAAIVDRLEVVAQKFLEAEQKAREQIHKKERTLIEDKIFRALGILQNARIISSHEFLNHLSMVRLGLDLQLLNGLDLTGLNELMLTTQPAHMQKMHHQRYEAVQRDTLRAEIIRKKIME